MLSECTGSQRHWQQSLFRICIGYGYRTYHQPEISRKRPAFVLWKWYTFLKRVRSCQLISLCFEFHKTINRRNILLSVNRFFIWQYMKDKLVTKNYIEILAANFLLYFGFYLLMPVLPFYLAEIFNSEKGTIGIILSCYTIAALCIRPFSGYLLDTFARKPLYLLAYFLFTAAFGGYWSTFPWYV